MQALLRSVITLGSRALSAQAEPNLALHPVAVLIIGRSSPAATRLQGIVQSNGLTTSSSSCQALATSPSVDTNATSLAPTSSAEASLPPAALSSAPLHLDGSRSADPGEPSYTAPYWIPPDVRKAHRLPTVLFTDPWPAHEDHALRRSHAKACLEHLQLAGRPLTLEQVFAGVNQQLTESASSDPSAAGAAAAGSGTPLPPLATLAYAKMLLEHLRRHRMIYGMKNPDSALSSGHPKHPRLYSALPFQAERLGHPEVLARQDAAERQAAVEQALRRLRRGKPPYAIHRRRARFSAWQHMQLQEELQKLQQRPAIAAE